MRNWSTVLLLAVLLVAGGLLLLRLQAGEAPTLTSGYVPALDSTQALLLAGAVSVILALPVGIGVTLAIAMAIGSRQVALARSQAGSEASPATRREPSAEAIKAPGRLRRLESGAILKTLAVATNAVVLAFVAYVTLDHYVLNPGEPQGEVEPLPGHGIGHGTAPTAPALEVGDLPAAFAALPAGDAARGKLEFSLQPCASCHSLRPDEKIVGPSLAGIGDRASSRQPGQSAEFYLFASLVQPGAYIVEDFQDGVMPANFGQSLTAQQQADLLAFLLTLK